MLIDLHTHTREMSYCSYLEANELVKKAKERGLDAVCITEHDEIWSASKVQELARANGVLVLRGVELSTNFGHILVYGLEKLNNELYRVDRLRAILDDAGGYMVVSHPFRYDSFTWGLADDNGYRRRERRTIEDAAGKPVFRLVDALETINGGTNPDENKLAGSVAGFLGLPGTAGSDAHHGSQVGSVATEFERQIESEADLVRELRAGRFRARDLLRERSNA